MIVYFIFLILSISWLAILFVGPYFLAHGGKIGIMITLYYNIFSLICHQKPERSYFVWDYQMPVCVRCFGIYLGIVLGALIYPFFKKLNNTKIPKLKYLWFFITPIVFDGLCQTLNLYPSPHYVRLLTGITASTSLVFYTLPLFNGIYNRLRNRKL